MSASGSSPTGGGELPGEATPGLRRGSEAYFRALIEHSSDITVIVDARARFRYVSPSVGRVLGYVPEALVGRGALEFVHSADAAMVMEALTEVLKGTSTLAPVGFRFRAPDGSWRHLEAVGRPWQEEGGAPQVLVNTRDVTDRIALEEQLRQAQKLESIGRLAGGVAHDFNNILTVIQGHASLLQMFPELPEPAVESAQQIFVAAERAAHLTRQLLTFSRKQVLQARPVDVASVAAGMAKMLQRILGEDVALHLHFAADLPRVQADQGMLEQVLMNLVVNSRDAMPRGGQLILNAAAVTLGDAEAGRNPESRPGRFVRLSVADTGMGIPPQNLGRIFEPFFTTKEVGRGTGLGLATVHGIMQQHRGWVEVASEMNRGTVFLTYWPVVEEGDAAAGEGMAPGAGAEAEEGAARVVEPGGGETILVVEDEGPLRELVQGILERQGYEVLAAASGAEALRMWPEHRDRIRLLLTDMVMPDGVSGRELAGRLQEERPDLRVIYTSGYGVEVVDREGQLREGYDFLQKPYHPRRLAEAVRGRLDEA